MGWFSDFVKDPVGTVLNTAKEVVTDPGKVLNDIGKTVDIAVIQPIKNDPLTFLAAAVAYSYGIPGLSFAGAGSAASVGLATTGSRLAQGDSFNDAVKTGAKAAAFTAVGNYIKSNVISGSGAIPEGSSAPAFDGSGASIDASGASIDASGINNTSNYTGIDQNSFSNNAPAFDGSGATVFEPVRPADLVDASSTSYLDPTQARNPLSGAPPAPPALNLDMGQPAPPEVNIRDLQGNTNAGTPAINAETNPQMNAGQTGNSIYRSEFVPEAKFVPGSANQPATGTPDKWGPHPDYPNDPNVRVKIESGQPGLPEVVDKSTLGTPMDGGTPTAGQAWDYTKALGNAAVDFAIDHPYYTAGGLYLLSQLGSKDKPKDDGGGSGSDSQVGDSRFYQPLQQLSMVQNYDPYKDDIYKYGQDGGEHQFLSSPVYVPVSYADGGQVGMPDGDLTSQPFPQGPAVGAMMAPTQAPQQPMGALGQINSMANQPSPIAPSLGRPPLPQQPPRLGATQKVTPAQQNPAYRYFSYGQIPPTVGAPLQPVQQMPQQRATGGLAMAHGGNVTDGRTDNIPAMLSPGEYVMDAETVALLGNGNNDAGAKRLDHMREAIRKQKGGALSKGKISPDAQSPLAYLSRSMA